MKRLAWKREVKIVKKPTYEELEAQLAEAKAVIEALHNEQTDGIVDGKNAALVRTKKMEEKLRESEATTRVLLNAPADFIALVDTKGIILDTNEAMAQRLGRKINELVGMNG